MSSPPDSLGHRLRRRFYPDSWWERYYLRRLEEHYRSKARTELPQLAPAPALVNHKGVLRPVPPPTPTYRPPVEPLQFRELPEEAQIPLAPPIETPVDPADIEERMRKLRRAAQEWGLRQTCASRHPQDPRAVCCRTPGHTGTHAAHVDGVLAMWS